MDADVLVDWGAPQDQAPERPSWLMLEHPPRDPAVEAAPEPLPEAACEGPAPRAPEEPEAALEALGPSSESPIDVGAPPTPEANDERDALRLALVHAITAGVKARRYALAAAERDLVELATAIARQIVAREISTSPAIVAGWAREGLTALGQQDQVVVAVAPDVAELMPAEAWTSALDGLAPLIVDRSLPAQGCEVRGRYGRVDAGVEARLASVVEALGVPLDAAVAAEAP